MRFLTNLFKSRATKETERFKAEADMARLSDALDKLFNHVTYKLNDFCRGTGFEIGSERLNAYKDAMWRVEGTDTKAKIEQFNRLAVSFVQDMDKFKADMIVAAENSLGEFKYTMIELGARDDLHRLIDLKVDQLQTILIQDGANEARIQYARIAGVLHTDGTIMTEEEVRAKHGTA